MQITRFTDEQIIGFLKQSVQVACRFVLGHSNTENHDLAG
jgi:hypothetical protein